VPKAGVGLSSNGVGEAATMALLPVDAVQPVPLRAGSG